LLKKKNAKYNHQQQTSMPNPDVQQFILLARVAQTTRGSHRLTNSSSRNYLIQTFVFQPFLLICLLTNLFVIIIIITMTNMKLYLWNALAFAGTAFFAVHEHVEKNRLTRELANAQMQSRLEINQLTDVASNLQDLVWQLENKSVFDGCVTAVYGRMYDLFSSSSSYNTAPVVSANTDNDSNIDNHDKTTATTSSSRSSSSIPSPSRPLPTPPDPPTTAATTTTTTTTTTTSYRPPKPYRSVSGSSSSSTTGAPARSSRSSSSPPPMMIVKHHCIKLGSYRMCWRQHVRAPPSPRRRNSPSPSPKEAFEILKSSLSRNNINRDEQQHHTNHPNVMDHAADTTTTTSSIQQQAAQQWKNAAIVFGVVLLIASFLFADLLYYYNYNSNYNNKTNKTPRFRQVSTMQHFVTTITTTLQTATATIIMASGTSRLRLRQALDLVMYAFCDCLPKMMSSSSFSSCFSMFANGNNMAPPEMTTATSSFGTALHERTRSILHVNASQAMHAFVGLLCVNPQVTLLLFLAAISAPMLFWHHAGYLVLVQLVAMWFLYRSSRFLGTILVRHGRLIMFVGGILAWLVVVYHGKEVMWNDTYSGLYKLWVLLLVVAVPVSYGKLWILYPFLWAIDIVGRSTGMIRYIFFGNQIAEVVLFLLHAGAIVDSTRMGVISPAAIILLFNWIFYAYLLRAEQWGHEAKKKREALFGI
jgi:hypothetical protein